jgi:hypothetical protein
MPNAHATGSTTMPSARPAAPPPSPPPSTGGWHAATPAAPPPASRPASPPPAASQPQFRGATGGNLANPGFHGGGANGNAPRPVPLPARGAPPGQQRRK